MPIALYVPYIQLITYSYSIHSVDIYTLNDSNVLEFIKKCIVFLNPQILRLP